MPSTINIENSYFLYNKIDTFDGFYNGGNPCINTMNTLSKININFSTFKGNQAYYMSNCLKIEGLSFNLSNSLFEDMSYISNEPDLDNNGALSLSSDQANIWNVTFAGNRAFKAAAILVSNLNVESRKYFFSDSFNVK